MIRYEFFLGIGVAMFFWTAYQASRDQVYIAKHSHKLFGRRRSARKGMVWVSRSRAPFRFWSAISGQFMAMAIFIGIAVYMIMK